MSISNIPSITITPDIVSRYENKVEKKKSIAKLELFLQKLNPDTTQFASEDVYKRFLKLTCTAAFSDSDLYHKSLRLFRQTALGLPADCFDSDVQLHASDKTTIISCSKQLLTKSYLYFER